VGVRDGVNFNDEDPTLVTYNCASGKGETAKRGKAVHAPPVLMREINAKYPGFRSILGKRRANLKLLYKRYREKTGFKAVPADNAHMKQAAGRNDPCPCGSGKKFKTCCGS
jgi:preprotein translocase subunit SecA